MYRLFWRRARVVPAYDVAEMVSDSCLFHTLCLTAAPFNMVYVYVQDAFGNYVVQYVLELGQVESCRGVIQVLAGQYAELSMQKFSSNVVEKCLKLSGVVSLTLQCCHACCNPVFPCMRVWLANVKLRYF